MVGEPVNSRGNGAGVAVDSKLCCFSFAELIIGQWLDLSSGKAAQFANFYLESLEQHKDPVKLGFRGVGVRNELSQKPSC